MIELGIKETSTDREKQGYGGGGRDVVGKKLYFSTK